MKPMPNIDNFSENLESIVQQGMSGAPPLRARALQMFHKANWRSRLTRLWARLTGKPSRLDDLTEVVSGESLEGSTYIGIKAVDMENIHGTQGRAEDFDAEFNPIRESSRSRWLSVALARLRGQELPPVELIQVGDVYYVRDGHHRISVARMLGQRFIDAEITRMEIRRNLM